MDLADGSSLCGRGARNGRYVLTAVPNPRIAIVYQNDDLGKDFVSGFKSGLGDKAASTIVSEQSYDVSDPTIQSQMVSAKASGANVRYFAGTVKYAIMNIRIRHELGWEPVHLICSTAAGVETTMKGAGFDKAEGVISTSYIKDANDARWEDEEEVQAFMAWMKENLPNKSPKDNGAVVGYMTSYII